MLPTTERILADIPHLPVADLEAVSQRVNEILRAEERNTPAPDENAQRERDFARQMVEEGFFARLPPCDETDAEDDFAPLQVAGEPLSEQILRERR